MTDTSIVGTHVVYHSPDGNDYEAVITAVTGPWSVSLDVGKQGTVENATETNREYGGGVNDILQDGTYSYKPSDSPDGKAGSVLQVRSDMNPRVAGAEAPAEELASTPEAAVRSDQVHAEEDAPNEGDPGLDTPANYETDQHDEQGKSLPPPQPVS